MTAHIPGELAILFALACNVVAGLAFFMVARGNRSFERLAHNGYLLFTIFSGVAVAYLYALFFTHNYAFKYVYEYSERAQSNFYILSAFWGGQEGTYLLWLFFNALFGYVIISKGGQYKNWAMSVFSLVNLFFLLILVKLSPFALLPTPAADGLGLNPLLRDPWMVIHPPVVFVGYAMAAVPFVIAIAALIIKDFSGWLKRAFPWVAVTATFLAAGNILGGFWAYKTLGWGGFWAWDPVENSSFIPWIISLALLHGMIIERRSGALRKINLMLASFVFLLVVYGTFLTRSGVLADFSVHSFTDLGINNLLIAFMAVTVLLTAGMFATRWRSVPTSPMNYNYYGREFSLFAGMTLLTLFGLVVLFWTSLPLLTKLVGAEPRAANPETYNSFALPLAIVMSFLLTIAPFVQFQEFRVSNWARKFLAILLVTGVLGFGLFVGVLKADIVFGFIFVLVFSGMAMYLYRRELLRTVIPSMIAFIATIAVCIALGITSYLFILFFATGMMAATSNVLNLAGFFPSRWKLAGGPLTHFGFGVMVVGILATTAFSTSQKLVIPRGGDGQAYDRSVHYDGMVNDFRHPNNQLKLRIEHDGTISDARPQLYYSERMQGTMRKPYIDRSLLADLYMAPEQIQEGTEESHITLAKGESKTVGNVKLTFRGYDMSQHGDPSAGGMRVAANLEVEADGSTTTIAPALEHQSDSTGNLIRTGVPASLTVSGTTYNVEIEQILADQGAVVLTIPGLSAASPEQLVIDVSRKPLINLVWGGALLVMIGSLLTFLRRRSEMGVSASAKSSEPQLVEERARRA